MSQALFASYLGLGRPTLALVETDRRSMPDAAMMKLGLLLKVTGTVKLNPSAKATVTLQKQSQNDRSLINKHAYKCSMQAELLVYKLNDMKLQYQQCMKALQVSAHVLANITNTAADKLDKETMQLLELETLRKLQRCGPGAQAMLALKIKVLNYEADQAGKLVF